MFRVNEPAALPEDKQAGTECAIRCELVANEQSRSPIPLFG